MKDNDKFWRELKALVVFLASGAFAAVHNEFIAPSPEFTAIFPYADNIHLLLHFIIGVVLQLVILGLLCKIAWNVLFRRSDPEDVLKKKDSNGHH